MADPYRFYSAGDPLPRESSTFDAFGKAARGTRDRLQGLGANARELFRQGAIVRVKNETGDSLGRKSVVGLNGPIFNPTDSLDAFLRETTFRGIIPTADHAGRFAILLEPALNNGIVRAYVAGVTQVQVNVTDILHHCAEVVPDVVDSLGSSDAGSAQILWTETGDTGLQWALVRFGTACPNAAPPDSFPLPGCPCALVPGTLFFHVTNAAYHYAFPESTIVYGPVPADLGGTGPNGWWGTEALQTYDAFGNPASIIRYFFGCQTGVYYVAEYPIIGQTGYGSSNTVETFLVGSNSNQCTPFDLPYGGIDHTLYAGFLRGTHIATT